MRIISWKGPDRGHCCHYLEGLFLWTDDDDLSHLNTLNSQLADVDNAEISKDFSLTREGREPAREMVMARLAKEPIFAANKDAALNMLSCRYVGHMI